MEVEATAGPSQVGGENDKEEDLYRDWAITYLDGTPFIEPLEASDDEEPDTELELAEHEHPVPHPDEGLKALGDFVTNHYSHNVKPPFETEPDTPILTPNPASALREWPMEGHDIANAATSFKNSEIGIFMSSEYPKKKDIEVFLT